MYKKVLVIFALLVAVTLGVGGCTALAGDKFYLKDGLYVPENDQCYKIEYEAHPEGEDYGEGIYVRTKDGSVVEISLGFGARQIVKKVVRKNNNFYTISFEYRSPKITQDHTYVYKIHADTSFSEVEEIYDNNVDIRARNFKPTTYKYCGDPLLSDKRDEHERKSDVLKNNNIDVKKQNKMRVVNSIAGVWSGYFPLKNSNGKSYMINLTYVITRDSNNSGAYHFTQTSFLKFDNPTDTFSCTNTSSYSNTYQGDIVEDSSGYRFIQKIVSNPKCGTLDVDLFRLNGDHIDVVNVSGGKIRSGYLTRN